MIFDAIRKHTKIVIFIVVIAFGIGGAFMGLGGLFTGGTPQFYRDSGGQVMAVATVNGEDLYYQDLYRILYNYQQQFPQQIRGMELLPFKYRILNAMVEEKIVFQEADRRNISASVSDEAVEEEIESMVSHYASSREEFEELLARSNYTLSQLQDEIRKELNREATSRTLWEQVVLPLDTTDAELLSQLEEVQARHILIDGDEDALAKAENLRERLLSGEEFSQLAREYSSCPSGDDGGDLGFFQRGSMVPPFEEVAFSLPPGEISEVVETEFGYHIILVEDRKNAHSMDDERQEEILEELRQDKKDAFFDDWLASMKEETEIVINDPAILGYKYQTEENVEEAIFHYQQALDYDPDNAYLYAHLGALYRGLQDIEQALEAYQEAVELAPYDMQILFTLGEIHQEVGDEEKALLVYDEIQEWAGEDLTLHYQLLDAYHALGEEERVLAQEQRIQVLQDRQMEEFRRQLEAMEKEELEEELDEMMLQEEEDRAPMVED